MLPLWWEQSFQASDPPKIDLECDFERRWCKKSMTTASGAILGSAFFAPGRFFIDFGVPLGSQTGHFGPTFARLSRLFGQLWATMCFSFDRGCSGTVLGSILGVSGCLPGGIFREFWVILGVASVIRGPQFCSDFVPSLSKFQISRCSPVGSGLGWPALELQGRRSRGAC